MLVLYFIFVLLATYWIFKRSNYSVKKVPGPKGLPIVGKGLEFNSQNLLKKLNELANEYGDFFVVNMFGIDYLILNSEKVMREVIMDKHLKAFTNDRGPTFCGEYGHYGSQGTAFYKEGYSHVHNTMRKYMVKGLHFYGEDGIDMFENKIFSELGNLNEKMERIRMRGDEADMMALLQRSLSNVVSIALSGEVIPEGDEDEDMFWNFVDSNIYFMDNARSAVLMFLPLLRFLPGPYKRNWQRLNDSKAKLIKHYFVAQKKTHIPGKPRGICDVLFDAQEEEKAKGDVVLTDEKVICNIMETVIAGITTTWSILSSTIFLLLHHPEFQDRLAKALQAITKQGEAVRSGDKAKSPLMEALELETHRLLLVTPMLLTRVSRKDVEYKGYTINEGTIIISNVWKLHHDETIWGDPWKFRPERFIDQNGVLLPREHQYRTSWMPFGIGKRACLAEPFARARYFLYVATLLRNWSFCPPKDQPLRDYDPRHLENFDIELTLRPKPYLCRIEKREWN